MGQNQRIKRPVFQGDAMKRLIALSLFLIIIFSAASAFGVAGSVVTTVTKGSPAGIVTVTFVCTGGTAGDAGTIPNTAVPTWAINYLSAERPYYLYRVVAYPTGMGTSSFVFVDADVSVANDTITEAAHGYSTGDSVDLATAGVLPGGLAADTTYYVISVDVNTISLATTAANATAGSAIDITSAAGGGNHTLDANRPDAASVFVLNANSFDYLGSEDGGTTAWAGLNLVHATLERSTFPNMYLPRAGLHSNWWPEIREALTLQVSDQATARAVWTVELIFVEGQ